MNKETINYLHTRAKALGVHLMKNMRNSRNEHVGPGDWAGYAGEDLEWEKSGNNITFKRKGHLSGATYIKFNGVSPKDIVREVLHPPRQIGGTTVDAQTTDFYNDTSVEQTRIYTVLVGEENSVADDIGVSLTLGFTQQFSVGGDLAFSQAVFSFQQTVTTNYNKHLERTSSKNTTTETEITVPSRKKVTVTTERKIGNLEQDLEYWCDLDYGIEIWSHNDFYASWSSTGELKDMLMGIGDTTGGSEDRNHTSRWYRDLGGITDQNIKVFFPGEGLHFKTTAKFDKATTGSVRVLESNL